MNRIVRFFEDHVEKMVLVVVGIACAWVLITRVIFSPNRVSFDDRTFSPSAVDSYVYDKARELERRMSEPVELTESYKPRLPEFVARLELPFEAEIKTLPPVPQVADSGGVPGIYRLPEVGDVTDVAVEHIRAVGYIPVDEVTPESPYDKAGNEPNDLDLVTVEAKFDVQRLYENFSESYFENVDDQYADPCLAKPVFAAVNLQRQRLDEDGNWGPWENVPRARIDHNKGLFKIAESIENMPAGGLKVQMLQFDYKQTQIDLLQPQPYQFASAREEWFPPSLHDEFISFQEKELQEERRKAREDEKEARERDDTRSGGRRSTTDSYGTPGGTRGNRGGGLDQYGGGGLGNTGTRNRSRSRDSSVRGGTALQPQSETGRGGRRGGRGTSGRRSQGGDVADTTYGLEAEGLYGLPGTTQRGPRKPTINDVYIKYNEVALTRLTDFSKIREPLVFWAHDDTVEPGDTYRYRIRLGVFNALAGTDRMSERDKALKNQVVLWSKFSDITEPVSIMERVYFFANGLREADKTVTVQVSRLALGHWYSHDFAVKQGEAVGEPLEYEPEKPDRRTSATAGNLGNPASAVFGALGPGMGPGVGPGTFGTMQDQSNVPETIDYATGAVMVDAVPVTDWTGGKTMRSRRYHDMLYSLDGIDIKHMPIGRSNWPKDLQIVSSTISRLEKEPLEPFKAFGSGGSKRQGGLYEGMGDEMMYEEGYYQDMGGLY